MIAISVNGAPRQLEHSCSVTHALRELGYEDRPVLVELNRVALLKSEWPHTRVQEGDAVEIVHIVAGG